MSDDADQPEGAQASPEKKSTAVAARDDQGRFVPGVSGNPGGKLPMAPEVKALCVAQTPANITKLVELRDTAKDPWVVLEAIQVLLQYGHGKPSLIAGPLVNVNVGSGYVRGPPSNPDMDTSGLDAAQVYKLMMENVIAIDPEHPAYRPPRKLTPEEVHAEMCAYRGTRGRTIDAPAAEVDDGEGDE